MSGLEWYWAFLPYLDPPERQQESALNAGYIKVVSLSEADKVIEDKDKRLRRHQYKRCLDKAELCHWKMAVFSYKKEKSDFYYRWYKRWSELANKFK